LYELRGLAEFVQLVGGNPFRVEVHHVVADQVHLFEVVDERLAVDLEAKAIPAFGLLNQPHVLAESKVGDVFDRSTAVVGIADLLQLLG
jgi:hypothetical protein